MLTSYYKTLDYRRYPDLQQQCIKWLDSQGLVHGKFRNTMTPLAVDQMLSNCPLISDFLNSVGSYNIVDATMYRIVRDFDFVIEDDIHIDYSKNRKRSMIEIPVIGCSHSERVFYQASVKELKTSVNGLSYWICDPATAIERARVRVERPTVLSLVDPSSTQLLRPFVNRISILLRVTPDAEEFIR